MALTDLMHGTSAVAAEIILKEGFRIPANMTIMVPRYGNGIYFYDGPKRLDHASTHAQERFGVGTEIAVLDADSNEGQSLDFFDNDQYSTFVEAHDRLAKLLNKEVVPVSAAIDFCAKELKLDIIIASIFTTTPLARPEEFSKDELDAWIVVLRSPDLISRLGQVV